jgi:hypothetical protein
MPGTSSDMSRSFAGTFGGGDFVLWPHIWGTGSDLTPHIWGRSFYGGSGGRAPAFTFFSIKIPLKVVCSEEKKLPQGRKSQKRKKNEALYRTLFDFFDLAVKNFSMP